MFDWTEERIKMITELWLDGWTSTAIAQKLHVSRRAVSGRLNRLGRSSRMALAPRRYLRYSCSWRPRGKVLQDRGVPHTTRAALTGLRKRGFPVERIRNETKGSLYRIANGPNAAAGA